MDMPLARIKGSHELHEISENLMDDAPHLEGLPAEIEQRSEAEACRRQVMQCLGLMCRCECGHGFYFQNDFLLYHKIGSILSQEESLVVHGQKLLTLVGNRSESELVGQRFFVDRLKKAGAQQPVHLLCRSNYSVRKFFVQYFRHNLSNDHAAN